MKRWMALMLLAGAMAFAQDAPKPAPTVASLAARLAQKDIEIATLRLQLAQATASNQIQAAALESVFHGQQNIQQAQQALEAAQHVAVEAQVKK